MFLTFVLISASFHPTPSQQPPLPRRATSSVTSKSEGYKQAAKLVDLMGVRQRLLDSRDKTVEAGKEAIARAQPDYDPAFSEEWAKRMRAQMSVDDYLDVFIQAYAKHFDTAELTELVKAQAHYNESKVLILSKPLQAKLTSLAITIQSEVMGGCAQVGFKLGAEIGQEIGHEHPEWIRPSKRVDKAVPKI